MSSNILAAVSFAVLYVACILKSGQAQPFVSRPYKVAGNEIPFSCRSLLIANACEMAGGVCSRRNPYRPWEARVCTFPALSNEAKQKQAYMENSPMFDGFGL